MTAKDPMYSCPKFVSCSCPVCPLDSAYATGNRLRLEGEAECTLAASARYALGEGLKHHGLFIREKRPKAT